MSQLNLAKSGYRKNQYKSTLSQKLCMLSLKTKPSRAVYATQSRWNIKMNIVSRAVLMGKEVLHTLMTLQKLFLSNKGVFGYEDNSYSGSNWRYCGVFGTAVDFHVYAAILV